MAILDQSQVAGSTLGYAQITSNFSTTSATQVQVTGLTTTVTIPSGGRRVRISMFTTAVTNSTAAQGGVLTLWDGTVGSGTQLAQSNVTINANSLNVFGYISAVVTPVAGSKTYNAGISATGGTVSVNAGSANPSYILVELI